jgi:hypothetical protein
MIKKPVFFKICVLIHFLYLSLVFAIGPNIVPNPSFEEITLSVPPINFLPARPATEFDPPEYKVNIPEHWEIRAAYARGYFPAEQGWGVGESAHSGERCIFLADAPAFPAWYSEEFPLEAGTAYLAEVFIDATGMRYHDYVRLIFCIFDESEKNLGYEEIVSARMEDRNIRSDDFGEKGWRKKQVYIKPRIGQAKMCIIIRLINTGKVYIDDISVRALTPEEVIKFEPPYRQKIPELEMVEQQPRIKATGFYHVQKVDGVWWLVDPEGQLTWSIGVQSIGNILWENPSLTKIVEESYGGNQSFYIEDQIPRLRSWNFTTIGAWSGPAFYDLNKRLIARGERPFPSFHFIGFTTVGDQEFSIRNRDGMVNDFGEHAMVDPFNKEWQRRAEELVKNITSQYENVPWLVGYFVDNEIQMKNLTRYLYSTACNAELVNWLQKKYKNKINNLNEKWSDENQKFSFKNFGEIGQKIPDQNPTPSAGNDLEEFVRYLMKTYIDFTVDIIRKYDKNHLIISNRFALGSKKRGVEQIGNFVDLFSRYDIVCTNLYAQSGGSYTPDQMALLQFLYDNTGRPLLIGEWSFHAKESNIPVDWWGDKVVDTMKERGEAYNRAMMSWAYLPYMVGAHFYKWGNGYGPVGRYRGRNSGIVDDQNQPYQPFVDMITKTNHDVLHVKRNPNGNVNDFEYEE